MSSSRSSTAPAASSLSDPPPRSTAGANRLHWGVAVAKDRLSVESDRSGAYVFGPFGLSSVLEQVSNGDGPSYVNINDAHKIVVESRQNNVFTQETQQLYAADVVGSLNFVTGTNGPFERFDNAAFFSWALIDSRGRVVFNASLDKGRGGIFNGPDPVANKVVDYAGAL